MRKSLSYAGALCLALFVVASIISSSFAAGAPKASPPVSHAAEYSVVLNKYCVTCHNEKLHTAGIAFDKLDVSNVGPSSEVWEKVVRKLRARAMPPTGLPKPDEATYDSFVTYLEGSLDAYAAAKPNPGRPALHRLNRTEYANAVHDLLGLDIDVTELLPPDDSGYGFDNIADVLGVSPLLLESYMNAAKKIARLAVGDPNVAPVKEVYRAPIDETQDYHLDGLPLGTRGGLQIQHQFPTDGEYEIQVKLARSNLGQVRGLNEPHDMELSLDGSQVKMFHIDGGKKMYAPAYYEAGTLSDTADEGLRIKVHAKAGPHDVMATFPIPTDALSEDATRPSLKSFPNGNSVNGLPHVGSIIISGPFSPERATDTPSRRRIFVCRPAPGGDDLPCAHMILSTLARRAYRRPVTESDLTTLLDFYRDGRKDGGFEAGIEMALWRMLASPQFTFRFEYDPASATADSPYRVSDLELASRLSFFLWSSIPDDELLSVAARGELHHPAVLEREVNRMLADPRSKALTENFAGQWLMLRNLRDISPDPSAFPDFDDNLREAFYQETTLFFDSILRENRSVLDLLNADYTFVNERLAEHYGIPGVSGSHFRRVTITDQRRRGLLGQGSILMVTSYANRTSVVLRGKWVLDNILGLPPPPPPPNVPELPDAGANGKVLTMREQMAAHRNNPVCASCHSKMDPIGLSLENFDAVGKWRDTDSGNKPLDVTGTLPDGTSYSGPVGLREALLAQPQAFAQTLTEKLLIYALGRGLESYDEPAVRAILRETAPKYTLSSIIIGIVKSTPFQMRRSAPSRTPVTNTAAADGGPHAVKTAFH